MMMQMMMQMMAHAVPNPFSYLAGMMQRKVHLLRLKLSFAEWLLQSALQWWGGVCSSAWHCSRLQVFTATVCSNSSFALQQLPLLRVAVVLQCFTAAPH